MSAAPPWPGRSGARQWYASPRSATWAAHEAPVRRVPWRKTMVGRSSPSTVERATGRGGRSSSVVDELAVDRVERRLRPRLEVELAEDVADVRPGGPLRDPEIRRDLLVAPAVAHEAENLELALRQRLGRLRV